MRKSIIALCVGAFLLTSCDVPLQTPERTYQSCGLLTLDCMDPNVQYEASIGNIVIAVLFWETVIIPVYIAGWRLWEPIALKPQHRS